MSDRIFFDTNILVYMADSRENQKQEKAILVFENAMRNGEVFISTQVLQELYNIATKKLRLKNHIAENLVKSYFALNVVQVDIQIIERAMKVSRKNAISFWDALIVSAASESGCSVLFTEDLNEGQIIEGVRIENPLA